MKEMNRMLEKLATKNDLSIKAIQEKVTMSHNLATLKYGADNYYFQWEGQSPSQLQELLQIENSKLHA